MATRGLWKDTWRKQATSKASALLFQSCPRVTKTVQTSLCRGYATFRPGRLQPSDDQLAQLEQEANNSLQNPMRQAAYYKAIKNSFPETVIERYESGSAARNIQCDEIYADSLENLGRYDQAEQVRSRVLNESTSANSSGLLRAFNTSAGSRQISQGQQSLSQSSAAAPLGVSKDNPLHVVMQQSRAALILSWVRFLLTFGLTVYIVLLVIGTVASAAGIAGSAMGGLDQAGKREAAVKEMPNVKFSDVHGVDEAKEDLMDVVNFLKNPAKYTGLGGKLPKGILLTGPPGTGKTLLARAIAGEAGVPFFFMAGSDFDEMFVGVGAKRIRELFAQAKAKAPSIVFIDELDAVGAKRNPKDSSYLRQTLNQLLVELDGFEQNSGVVFIGATNFPQSLDKALTRPGRFDIQINVPLPDVRGRMQILQHHAKTVRLAANVDFSTIARGTSGFSGADLANLINQAAIKASKDMALTVTIQALEYAKDRIMMGAERRSKYTTEESKLMTAWHEAGHALVAFKTDGAMEPYKATIMPRGFSLGMTMLLPEMDKDSRSRKEYQAMIDVAMGGRVAELLIYGKDNVTSGAHSDINNATNVAKEMVISNGMSDKVGPVAYGEDLTTLSPTTKALVEAEIKSLIEGAEARATQILTTHRVELERLAKGLVEYEILNKEEMQAIMDGRTIDRPKI
ncbi:ATP-dependent zinc metalloprotease YME1 homolog [Taphrina deformans PYCC 5710]|uniref:ATP-dependent zinc metalloprotease YME1 homolog n=1 Tax=Taphrina deformans (strain PYCC 5710 / ATCC 11124 / CBS 356.35 / IMI 108563 / JCM 9778 / NBRC 8474) TaxID=1097556 RepID=R4X8B5_TAPDE|nr:ATP-dependent zinc metalloprotease YME1 homolog [Taphrina deformans PYCC 5710]|eukprot:CCG81788.1 ATP-dependent zinc metalloprotease YME1 homolog [Taphrina deformans PYCC 5710]